MSPEGEFEEVTISPIGPDNPAVVKTRITEAAPPIEVVESNHDGDQHGATEAS
jgi:hypothetical protein